MRTTNFLQIATVAALALTACGNDEEMANVADLSNTPIRFSTSVNGLTAKTRSGYETGDLKEGSFGLFLSTEGATSDVRFNASNRAFTYANDAWGSAGTQLLWKDNDTQVSYTAYLPYSAEAAEAAGTASTAYPFSVPTDQSVADSIKAADFLYAQGTTTGTLSGTSGIALAFGHKMSKLTIHLSKGTEVADDVTFSSVKLDACCALATTVNLTAGTVAAAPTDAQTSSVATLEATAKVAYECVLVPQTIEANKFKVAITASSGKTYVYTATAATTFDSGKAYTLALNVGYDKVTNGTFTAESWGTPIAGSGLETE